MKQLKIRLLYVCLAVITIVVALQLYETYDYVGVKWELKEVVIAGESQLPFLGGQTVKYDWDGGVVGFDGCNRFWIGEDLEPRVTVQCSVEVQNTGELILDDEHSAREKLFQDAVQAIYRHEREGDILRSYYRLDDVEGVLIFEPAAAEE